MGLAALLLGIFGGLAGLTLAVYGHLAVAVVGGLGGMPGGQQDAAKLLLYGLPIITFVGAGLATSKAQLSALLLLGSAAGWIAIGAHFGYGINAFTATTVILDGIAGLLALGSTAGAENPSSSGEILISKSERNRVAYRDVEGRPAESSRTHHDVRKWQALLTYDEELAKIATLFAPLGQKWSDRLAADYLAIGDKAYLPEIARKIMTDARAEREREEAENKYKEEERLRIQAEHKLLYDATKKARPRRIVEGLAVFFVIALAGGVLWYLEVFQKTGLATPSAQIIVPIPQPASPNYGFEFPNRYPAQFETLRRILPPSKISSPDFLWLYALQGVAGPIITRVLDGRRYVGSRVCKPHDCGDNMIVFLVAEDASRAIGTIRSSGPDGFDRDISTQLPLQENERDLLTQVENQQ